MPYVHRATKDELYKVAGSSILSIAHDNDEIKQADELDNLYRQLCEWINVS